MTTISVFLGRSLLISECAASIVSLGLLKFRMSANTLVFMSGIIDT